MPSSSSSAGFSARATISSWLNASVATNTPFDGRRRVSISGDLDGRGHAGRTKSGRQTATPATPVRPLCRCRRVGAFRPLAEQDAVASCLRRKERRMAFEVPDLPYDYDALEPHVDEATMRVHHDKHHQAYVDNANAALDGTELADKPVEHVLANLDALPEDKRTAVQNNAGGHVNHLMFWEIMSPDGGGEPSGNLANAIEDVWGGVDELKKAINEN